MIRLYIMLAVCVAVAFVAGSSYLVVYHPFGVEEWHSTGAEARKWLDDAFVGEWTRSPFPADSVVAVEGVKRGWDTRRYWLRVQFRPEFGERIVQALRADLKEPGDGSITVRELPNFVERVTTEKLPPFWDLRQLGEDAMSIEVSRLNTAGAEGARGPVSSVIVRLSKSKGIAYIRYW